MIKEWVKEFQHLHLRSFGSWPWLSGMYGHALQRREAAETFLKLKNIWTLLGEARSHRLRLGYPLGVAEPLAGPQTDQWAAGTSCSQIY